jgi:integrase
MAVENRGTKKYPRWRYAFTIRGVRYRKVVPEARTQYEAERAEVQAKQDVYAGRYGRPAGDYDFAKFVGNPDAENDAFEEGTYLAWAKDNKRSWKFDQWAARVLVKFFRGKTFAQVSPLLVEKFKSERRKSITKRGDARRPASVNREFDLLRRIFTRAVELKLTDANPCSKVKKFVVNNKRRRYLLDEEEPLLLAACTGPLAHVRRAVIVAVGTGMRRGDQLNLRKSKVDFQRSAIWVPNAKTGNEYLVPMNPEVREVMLELVKETPTSEFLFVNPRTDKPYLSLGKGLAAACRLAGISDLHWHDLRHTFGTRLAEAGHSEATIAELMGHSDPKTTRRYTHGTERAKREAVEATRPRQQIEQPTKVVQLQK